MLEKIRKLQFTALESAQNLTAYIPDHLKATAMLRSVGFAKIPLLFATRPTVLEINDERAEIRIRLTRTTKNHLGSMYFGALAIGADSVVGMLAVFHMQKRKSHNIQLSFKDFKANFLKRPERDVIFVCEAGDEIAAMIDQVIESKERVNQTFPARAVVRIGKREETVAEFQLTLSLKVKVKE